MARNTAKSVPHPHLLAWKVLAVAFSRWPWWLNGKKIHLLMRAMWVQSRGLEDPHGGANGNQLKKPHG